MSFAGPPPSTAAPSGPFEESISKIASSPYTLALAILAMNLGSRFLPMEISKEQENMLNQPLFRRSIIFVIIFLATRNFITAGWMSFIIILCIGYLFNENSDLYIFGKESTPGVKKTIGDTVAMTPEENAILKSLQEKADKIRKEAEQPIALKPTSKAINNHVNYKNIIRKLWKAQ
jgi:hypothetical protein